MNSTIRALGMILLAGGTGAFALAVAIRCLWVHRFPTASEVLAGVCLILVTKLYYSENT